MPQVLDPVPTNSAVNVADEIEGLIFQAVVDGIEAYAKTQVPFLATPGISQIFDFLVGKLGGLIQQQLENFVAFSIIKIQAGSEGSDYQNAVNQLQSAYQQGDPNAIAQARQAVKTSLNALVTWEGA